MYPVTKSVLIQSQNRVNLKIDRSLVSKVSVRSVQFAPRPTRDDPGPIGDIHLRGDILRRLPSFRMMSFKREHRASVDRSSAHIIASGRRC